MKLPINRNSDLIEQDLGSELLIYDLRINKAYTLNETSMKVFRACDGGQTFEDLKRKYKFTDDLIYLALDELKRNGLIETEYSSPLAGLDRRAAIKRVGLATMFALPLIASITAPKALRAASRQAADQCEEVECPYAQNQCENDGTCDPSTGDCIVTFRAAGTLCDDGDASTTGDICNGSGVCAGTCASGLTDCGAAPRCRNLQNDPNNCGACGNTCAAGLTCSSGVCQGPVGIPR